MCKRIDLGELPELPKISKRPKVDTLEKFLISAEPNLNEKMQEVEKVWNEFLKIDLGEIPKFPIWTDWWDKDPSEDPTFYKKYTNWIDNNKKFYEKNKKVLEPWSKIFVILWSIYSFDIQLLTNLKFGQFSKSETFGIFQIFRFMSPPIHFYLTQNFSQL